MALDTYRQEKKLWSVTETIKQFSGEGFNNSYVQYRTKFPLEHIHPKFKQSNSPQTTTTKP